MKRYVIVNRNLGMFVDKLIKDEVTYTSNFSEAMIFNVLTFAFEFAETHIKYGFEFYEIILKKV